MTPDHELLTLVAAVAEALGAGWHSEEREEHRSAFLRNLDGRHIAIARDWRNAGRLDISGTYWTLQAEGRDRGVTLELYGLPQRAIHVSATREADAIAREITRRLLPTYDQGFADARARLGASISAKQGREATARQLGEVLRVEARNGSVHWSGVADRGYGEFATSHGGDSVRITLASVPAWLALGIARVLVSDMETPA